ncbi:hypothetical protein N7608_03550 [Klebsiella grimontii]|uniref:hypothetical protein n=1 Tax=Klebsiella grimontii TaxID=2058152 RepID=UPI00244C9AB9|nr:hypothetical protein [Klebsiella grimontii]MDG9846872.1 hypothetical protein [Klebsiella grimontii]MDG9961041.1 hypothetical protein [Klebsiella grimontii]
MASEKERLPGIKESEFFLNFECAARKYGLGILLGIILAALLGIFSGGYFSTAEKTNAPGNLTVTYERFGRLQTEFRLKITARPRVADKYIFSLGGDFTSSFEPGSIWPRPDRMYSQNDRLFLVYNDSKSMNNFSIWLYVTPTSPGKSNHSLQLNGEPEIRFWQFIYP